MLSHTSTEWAPWYVIPADRKWFGRLGAAAVLVHTLMEIDPKFPSVTKPQRAALLDIKQALELQAPKGAAPDPFEQEQQARKVATLDQGNGRSPTATAEPNS